MTESPSHLRVIEETPAYCFEQGEGPRRVFHLKVGEIEVGFDRRPIAAAKNLINHVSLPSADRLLDSLTSFTTALTWPEAQQRFQALFKRGWSQPGDMENRYSELLGTLMDA